MIDFTICSSILASPAPPPLALTIPRNFPDPHDVPIPTSHPPSILEMYSYGRPITVSIIDCIHKAVAAATNSHGLMGTQKRQYLTRNLSLIVIPDERLTWEMWLQVLATGMWFDGIALDREFLFVIVVEGEEGEWGRGSVLGRRGIAKKVDETRHGMADQTEKVVF
ncbi:MAG: hypothetical protein Q9220_005255 [cf. Caloplaca sp. 1 TL-2023]